MMLTTMKNLWGLCLLGVALQHVPVAESLSYAHRPVVRVQGGSSVAFSFRAHSRQCSGIDAMGNLSCRNTNLYKRANTRNASRLASTTTSREEAIEKSPTSAADGASSANPETPSESSTGSTAIILNMNARSVTPQLISMASDIVGEENVFVTRTMEDATLAARTVVRGHKSHTNGEEEVTNKKDEEEELQKYSLVIPVGGDGTLSGWICTLVDEMLLFDKLEHDGGAGKEDGNSKEDGVAMSVEEALKQLPMVGYLPMGTGNGLGYVIGCKAGNQPGDDDKGPKRSLLSRMNVLTLMKRRKLERVRRVMRKLKDVGDAVQEAEQQHRDISDAVSGKCSIVEMPLMEVTHPNSDGSPSDEEEKGDLCFFAGAGFDSLMLHDFQQIKAWSKSSRSAPAFIKDALSSVAGYCVALVTKTLPQTMWYGTHKIHVEVTTRDEDTLWVDHRRGDFSELAIAPSKENGAKQSGGSKINGKSQKLIYSGTTGIIAASTTPYYGGGMKLFPYARLIPDKLQLRIGRISPLTGFVNIPKIFEGSYREKGERSFGCLDFIGKDFEVEVRSGNYEEYLKQQGTDCEDCVGFPFQHSGESMGCKERFRLRVVQEPVKFVSFLEPRVVVTD